MMGTTRGAMNGQQQWGSPQPMGYSMPGQSGGFSPFSNFQFGMPSQGAPMMGPSTFGNRPVYGGLPASAYQQAADARAQGLMERDLRVFADGSTADRGMPLFYAPSGYQPQQQQPRQQQMPNFTDFYSAWQQQQQQSAMMQMLQQIMGARQQQQNPFYAAMPQSYGYSQPSGGYGYSQSPANNSIGALLQILGLGGF